MEQVKPVRIQRKRTRGYDMQAESRAINGLECVSVARPSRYGNPFIVGKDGTAQECVRFYSQQVTPYSHASTGLDKFFQSVSFIEGAKLELGGKNLSCFCALDQPCHADILLELANA